MASASSSGPGYDTIQLPSGRLKIQLKENATANSKPKTPPILYNNGESVELGTTKGSVKTVVDSATNTSFTLVRRVGCDFGYIQTQYLAQAGEALRAAEGVAAPAASASGAAAPLLPPGPFIPPWATAQQKADIAKSYVPPLTPGGLPVVQMNIPQPPNVYQASTGQYYKANADGSTAWFVQDPATGNYYLAGPPGTAPEWVGGTRRRKCKKGKCKKSRSSSRASQQLHRRRHSRHSRHHRRR
jgi:hypothetical protein